MNKLTIENCDRILKDGKVTAEIKKTLFSNTDSMEIRNILEENGLDRHMPIEVTSIEVAILTEYGILMKIRKEAGNHLTMWGGVISDDENPVEGAIRKFYEETSIKVKKEDMEFIETCDYTHTHSNGDVEIFHIYRYAVDFGCVPEIKVNGEWVRGYIVSNTIIDHQLNFARLMIGEIES